MEQLLSLTNHHRASTVAAPRCFLANICAYAAKYPCREPEPCLHRSYAVTLMSMHATGQPHHRLLPRGHADAGAVTLLLWLCSPVHGAVPGCRWDSPCSCRTVRTSIPRVGDILPSAPMTSPIPPLELSNPARHDQARRQLKSRATPYKLRLIPSRSLQ